LEKQAGRLQGHLMIQVGEEDENVLPASTLRFADALMKADKNFEFILVPNANHVINFGPRPQYLLWRGWDWLVRYLRDGE
jgi:dipeptidyl aminopeptidase/acylaminoacyl peptidase